MLTLVGLGLNDEKDLTLKGIDAAKNSDKVYIELYTGKWNGSLLNLERMIGKEIVQLQRKDLEENSEKILSEAKLKKVTVFVQGDPLVATTHSSLILEAKKNNVETKIIHNSSIFSAIAETGLHIYKFGPTVTIPFLEKTNGKIPESVYNTIKDNKSRGLHTLCLLDVFAENKKFMTPREGLEIIVQMAEEFGDKNLNRDSEVVVFSSAGSDSSKIFYGKIQDVFKKNFETPCVLIILGNLHFTESEFLKLYTGV